VKIFDFDPEWYNFLFDLSFFYFLYFIVFYCEIHLKYCQDTINRQFNSTMENNIAGKTACSLSYPGAGVR
jgi:hypothetical protein